MQGTYVSIACCEASINVSHPVSRTSDKPSRNLHNYLLFYPFMLDIVIIKTRRLLHRLKR